MGEKERLSRGQECLETTKHIHHALVCNCGTPICYTYIDDIKEEADAARNASASAASAAAAAVGRRAAAAAAASAPYYVLAAAASTLAADFG